MYGPTTKRVSHPTHIHKHTRTHIYVTTIWDTLTLMLSVTLYIFNNVSCVHKLVCFIYICRSSSFLRFSLRAQPNLISRMTDLTDDRIYVRRIRNTYSNRVPAKGPPILCVNKINLTTTTTISYLLFLCLHKYVGVVMWCVYGCIWVSNMIKIKPIHGHQVPSITFIFRHCQ